jgi:hypothetical protein
MGPGITKGAERREKLVGKGRGRYMAATRKRQWLPRMIT